MCRWLCRLVADSFGLNGSEGQVYKGTAPGECLTHAFRPGDVLGAGIIPAKGCVFFTYALPPSSHGSVHGSVCCQQQVVSVQEKQQDAYLLSW